MAGSAAGDFDKNVFEIQVLDLVLRAPLASGPIEYRLVLKAQGDQELVPRTFGAKSTGQRKSSWNLAESIESHSFHRILQPVERLADFQRSVRENADVVGHPLDIGKDMGRNKNSRAILPQQIEDFIEKLPPSHH